MDGVKENKMGTLPVPELLVKMAVPMIISMLVQALYNIVDSMFVARIGGASSVEGVNALNAVNLTFPIQNLMISFGVGLGVGVNAFLSKKLGEKDPVTASKAAMNGIFLSVILWIMFIVIGVCFSESFFRSQTNVDEVITYGKSYMFIVCVFSISVFFQIMFERLLISTGKTIFSMTSQVIGAAVNIVLDPILIYGLLGAPKMGVSGAAIATVAAQSVASCVSVFLNIKKNKEITFRLKDFVPEFQIIKAIFSVGIPTTVMYSIGSVMVYGMNRILGTFTDVANSATAVFGVYFKLQSFVFMPVFGMNNALIPIIAYNYGAKKKSRIIQTVKISLIAAVSMMLAGCLVFSLVPDRLIMIFNENPDMLAIGVPALRIVSLSYIFAGFSMIFLSTFQALGNGIYSMIVSVARQLVVILPVARLMSLTGVIGNIWWAFPIAEVICFALSLLMLVRVYRSKLKFL